MPRTVYYMVFTQHVRRSWYPAQNRVNFDPSLKLIKGRWKSPALKINVAKSRRLLHFLPLSHSSFSTCFPRFISLHGENSNHSARNFHLKLLNTYKCFSLVCRLFFYINIFDSNPLSVSWQQVCLHFSDTHIHTRSFYFVISVWHVCE